MPFEIADPGTWKRRMKLIQDEYGLDQTLVIVVGSGLSFDRREKVGVADVAQLVEWIRERGIEIPEGSPADQYQWGMKALKKQAGARGVSELIRRAILEAYQGANQELRRTALGAPGDPQREAGRMLEQEVEDWGLPRGMLGLAGWVRHIVDRRRKRPKPEIGPIHLVTTNFDPFIEIALKRCGVEVSSFSVPGDSAPKPTACSAMVWHVHGSWWDVTLHSDDALNRPRERLKTALEGRMRDAQLCVLGYGGWQDIVSSTYAEALAGLDGCGDLLWAFFEPTDAEILEKYRDALDRLKSAPAFSQVTRFRGIDLHQELLSDG